MKEKVVWNILRLTTGSYMYIYADGIYTCNFESKEKAYEALIKAIQKYNCNIEEYKEYNIKRAYEFSNYRPIEYSDFELVETFPIKE